MYSILETVYGIDFTDKAQSDETINFLAAMDILDSAYSGSGKVPYWFGKNYGGFDVFNINSPYDLLNSYPEDDVLQTDWNEYRKEKVNNINKLIDEMEAGLYEDLPVKLIPKLKKFVTDINTGVYKPKKVIIHSTS